MRHFGKITPDTWWHACLTRLHPCTRAMLHPRSRKVHRRRVVLSNVSLTFNTLKVLGMSDEINKFFEVSAHTPAEDVPSALCKQIVALLTKVPLDGETEWGRFFFCGFRIESQRRLAEKAPIKGNSSTNGGINAYPILPITSHPLPLHALKVTYAKPGRLSAGMTCAVDIAFTPKVISLAFSTQPTSSLIDLIVTGLRGLDGAPWVNLVVSVAWSGLDLAISSCVLRGGGNGAIHSRCLSSWLGNIDASLADDFKVASAWGIVTCSTTFSSRFAG